MTREVGSEAPVKTSPKEIREWAISEGHEVASRGVFRPTSSEPSVMFR
ncbi:Lsr2 family DNA-binding protein [Rhodococcus wratislaviensis]